MYTSNIVTCLPLIDDDIIYQHTKLMLETIENTLLKSNQFYDDCKIIFSIIKPILPKKIFLENVELSNV